MANVITVKEIPAHIGDSVKVHYLFKEGEKEKRQIFEGILMATGGMMENKMFTVRKMTKSKIGVERIFPVNSPSIEKIEVAKKGTARRAKVYFIRNMSEKEIRERLS